MKKIFLATALLAITGTTGIKAQENSQTRAYNDSGISAGFFDSSEGEGNINFSNFHLPPLSVLLENARQNPSILSLAKAEELARAEVLKQKKNVLSFLTGHASYSYGKTDLWGNNSTTLSNVIYQYQGNTQNYWSVGATLQVPVADLFDLGQSVRRKRIEAEKLEADKNNAFDQLKLQIATLYIKITNDLVTLKTASESSAAYQGAGALLKEQFEDGSEDIAGYAWHKMHELSTVMSYQELQSTILVNIITLEILTHTPIITNSTTDITLVPYSDSDTKKQALKAKKAEEKDLEDRIKDDIKAEKELIKKEKKEESKAQKALKAMNKNK